MIVWHVHYRVADGEIVGYENCEPPSSQPDCLVLSIETEEEPAACFNGAAYKVDIKDGPAIVAKTDAEKLTESQPSDIDTRGAIAAELARTDAYMVPDRPLSDDARAAWSAYRRSLRDLSKITDVAQRMTAWPLRPDGVDIVAVWKRRTS